MIAPSLPRLFEMAEAAVRNPNLLFGNHWGSYGDE
jgi:hypothetical protein